LRLADAVDRPRLILPEPWKSQGSLTASDRQIRAPEEGNCEACPEDPNIDARFLEILPPHAARVIAAKETALYANQPPGGGRDQCAPVGQRKEAPLYCTRLDGFAGKSLSIDRNSPWLIPMVGCRCDRKRGFVDIGFFKRATVYRLQMARGIEAREVEWSCLTGKEWSDTRLLFAMTHDKGKTLLRFTHADWKAQTDYFVNCTTTWGELMYRLKATAEGKSPGPLFSTAGLAY